MGDEGERVNRKPMLKFASGLDHRMLQQLNASCSKAQAMPSIAASNGRKAYCRLHSLLFLAFFLTPAVRYRYKIRQKEQNKIKTKQTEHDGLVTERRMKQDG